jgi:hypothetical protein
MSRTWGQHVRDSSLRATAVFVFHPLWGGNVGLLRFEIVGLGF